MFLDAISVATRGYLEADLPAGGGAPGSPVAQVAAARDHLRIGTRGFIILDLSTVPDPGTVMCLEFNNNGVTDADVGPEFTDALLKPEFTDMTMEPEFTEAECDPGPNDFTVQEQC